MKAKPEYLTQRSIEAVRRAKTAGKGFQISFAGGAYLEAKKGDPPEQDLTGLSLLTVIHGAEDVTLHFGRVRVVGDASEIIDEVNVTIQRNDLKVVHPDFPDDQDRDLTVPAHPDERVADGPETPSDDS